DTVGLTGYEGRNARTLSGGEMQRVALARAMAIEPELLLLDEPTANLDVASTRKVEQLLANIIAELRTAVILSTHDLAQGRRFADRIGVLIDGEMLQIGRPDEVFDNPSCARVAEFVSAASDFPEKRSGYSQGER
ncbi:MAG: ATP-binding cassette domain-containing protein, partial [Ardenticatenaceae bacterium]